MLFRKLLTTLLGSGLGVRGVEPPVMENLRLAPVIGGIKVRLGYPNLVLK